MKLIKRAQLLIVEKKLRFFSLFCCIFNYTKNDIEYDEWCSIQFNLMIYGAILFAFASHIWNENRKQYYVSKYYVRFGGMLFRK